jgi:hypothetical protein
MVVEIAGKRYDAMGSELGSVRGAPGEAVEPDPAAQQQCRAQRYITASDQQYPDHDSGPRTTSTPHAPFGLRCGTLNAGHAIAATTSTANVSK